MPRRRAVLAALWAAFVFCALLFPGPAGAQDDPLVHARAALAVSKYDVAEEALKKVKTRSAERAFLEARLYLWTGRYAEAAKAARAGAGLGLDAKVLLAPWEAEALVRQGKTDAAITVLEAVANESGAHRARLLLGELLIATGQRAKAEAPLMEVIKAYNDDTIKADDPEGLSLAGRAAYFLRVYKNANRLFDEADHAGAKKRVESLLWNAEMFLDKYNPGMGGRATLEAEKLAPGDPRVLVMLAKVVLDNAMDFAAAEERIQRALAVDPNLAEAYVVRAGLALRTLDIAAADAALDTGLKTNPNNLELLSMKAATRFLADDHAGFEALEKRVLAINGEYAQFYIIVSEFAEWEHRYDEIVEMMKKAVKIDPLDGKVYAALGLNMIRNGDDKAGLEEIDKAFKRDPYNPRTMNTLNLFDDIAKEYTTSDGAKFRIRYHKKEKRMLERYVPQMLEEAWGSMVKRYGFTPATPVGIELYADAQSFSIRTSGLPNVGIQGVCFGKTLAALSPSAGEFNWGMILWHELAHVFHIQMSKNHVPRWFTEGLAEYETIIRRPEWQREEQLALYEGLRHGKIPKVASFNRAFTHVDSTEDVVMAYFAASQISVFLAETFGFAKVAAHLPQWGAGKTTVDIVPQVLGISTDELDQRYRAWLGKKLAHYDKQFVPDLQPPTSLEAARKAVADYPADAGKLTKLALGLLAAGNEAEGLSTLQLALRKDPNEPNALFLQLRLAQKADKLDQAKQLVDKLIKAKRDGYAVRMRAADIAEAKKDTDGMKKHFFKAHRFDPLQVEPLQALYDVAHKAKDREGELWALRKVAELDQHDRRVWGLLLRALVERGKFEEARAVGESAIYVDVANPEIHWLYAIALARTGRQVSAIRELNSAIIAGAPPELAVKVYRSMAVGYRKLKKPEWATRAEGYADQVKALAPARPPEEDQSLRDHGASRTPSALHFL